MTKLQILEIVEEVRLGILQYDWDNPPTELDWEELRLATKHACNEILGLSLNSEPNWVE